MYLRWRAARARALSEPSMTKSPARTTAPPIRPASTVAVQPHFTLQSLLQRCSQPRALRFVELHSRRDVHVGDVLGVGPQFLVKRRDLGKHGEPAVRAPAC